jgi:hypothetical protein
LPIFSEPKNDLNLNLMGGNAPPEKKKPSKMMRYDEYIPNQEEFSNYLFYLERFCHFSDNFSIFIYKKKFLKI